MKDRGGRHFLRSPSYRQVAELKAHQRIQQQLIARLSKTELESLWSSLDARTEQKAIEAEVKKQGEGSRLLIELIRPSGSGPQ